MQKRKSKAEKIAEERVNKSFNRACKNIQINIMDTPKVFNVGLAAVAAGADDAALDMAMRDYVETIRRN